MFMLRNGCAQELREANTHEIFSHSKQLLKNVHQIMLTSFLFTGENISRKTSSDRERVHLSAGQCPGAQGE